MSTQNTIFKILPNSRVVRRETTLDDFYKSWIHEGWALLHDDNPDKTAQILELKQANNLTHTSTPRQNNRLTETVTLTRGHGRNRKTLRVAYGKYLSFLKEKGWELPYEEYFLTRYRGPYISIGKARSMWLHHRDSDTQRSPAQAMSLITLGTYELDKEYDRAFHAERQELATDAHLSTRWRRNPSFEAWLRRAFDYVYRNKRHILRVAKKQGGRRSERLAAAYLMFNEYDKYVEKHPRRLVYTSNPWTYRI